MKVRASIFTPSVACGIAGLCAAVFVASAPATARAAGVVGTGSAPSCNDAALNTALAGGGLVTFNCGADPVTIDISTGTGTKTIAADTTIDGGGLITISGGNAVAVFSVDSGINFTVNNLTIARGYQLRGIGGGISNDSGSLTVTNSTFTGNFALAGGGIHSGGPLTVTNSTFTDNSTEGDGGGIFSSGSLTVANSTFTGNFAGMGTHPAEGGGIFSSGSLTVANSTFTGNFGGATVLSSGGGIFSSGPLTVTNSTFTGNLAGDGGGIAGRSGSLLRNTVVANNYIGNCSGSITDGGHNLDDGTSCGFSPANGSLGSTDPQLDPLGLQNNGGPTETVALCTGAGVPAGCTAASPAIDAGDQAVCAAGPVNDRDQRGFVRPGTGHTQCSIGAYEADASAPACTGDCDDNGIVAINELILGVNIALGSLPVSACPAFENAQGKVDIAQLIKGVSNALNGCSLG